MSGLSKKTCNELKTPFEVIHEAKPNIVHGRIFGRKAFVHTPAPKSNGKFEEKSKAGILIGSCKGVAYGVLLSENKVVAEPKHATFDGNLYSQRNIEMYRTVGFDKSNTN